MSPNENQNLHSRIMAIVLSLGNYDRLEEWNDGGLLNGAVSWLSMNFTASFFTVKREYISSKQWL